MAGWEASRAVVPELLWRSSSPSTNAELLALAAERELPDLTTLATDDQTAGRGRLGREWVAPAGSALAVSVLVRPRLPAGEALEPSRFGWLPLAAGLAMCEAVAAFLPGEEPVLKWPNDVLVAGRKLCGVLAELAPSGDAVVLGAGVNLAMTAEQLPVPTATSLAVLGVRLGDGDADRLLAGYLARLRELVADYLRVGGDAEASGLHALVTERCATLGREVRVELPGGEHVRGIATSLDASGRLRVRRTSDGGELVVSAGDVTHLRAV